MIRRPQWHYVCTGQEHTLFPPWVLASSMAQKAKGMPALRRLMSVRLWPDLQMNATSFSIHCREACCVASSFKVLQHLCTSLVSKVGQSLHEGHPEESASHISLMESGLAEEMQIHGSILETSLKCPPAKHMCSFQSFERLSVLP